MSPFRKRRADQTGVNAGSMADIAFLLLIFFLVTTTILFDEGMLVKLPPWDPEETTIKASDDNVLSVLINSQNELLVEGQRLPVSDLQERTQQFILEEADSPRKAVVSLQNDRSTRYEAYLEVYNELLSAYHHIWDEQAQRKYQLPYDQLGLASQKTIRSDYPLVISEAEPSDLAVMEE